MLPPPAQYSRPVKRAPCRSVRTTFTILALCALCSIAALPTAQARSDGLPPPVAPPLAHPPGLLPPATFARASPGVLNPSVAAVVPAPHWAITASGGPTPRLAESLADDPGDGYVLMTGGYAQGIWKAMNDTWSFDHGVWTNRTHGVAPPSGYMAALTYDAADGYMVFVGGCGSTCSAATWTYLGGNWTQHPMPTLPLMEDQGASITYDAHDGYVVLFGGSMSYSVPGYSWSADMNWTWTYHAGVWTNLSPSHSPAPRYGAAMTYDAADGYVLLQGGGARNGKCVGTCALSDTWKFSGGLWTQLTPTRSPPAAYLAGMSYDAHLGRVVYAGGWANGPSAMNQTWTYLNGTWTHQVTPTAPPAVFYVAFTYNTHSGGFVAYVTYTPRFTWRSTVWTLH